MGGKIENGYGRRNRAGVVAKGAVPNVRKNKKLPLHEQCCSSLKVQASSGKTSRCARGKGFLPLLYSREYLLKNAIKKI